MFMVNFMFLTLTIAKLSLRTDEYTDILRLVSCTTATKNTAKLKVLKITYSNFFRFSIFLYFHFTKKKKKSYYPEGPFGANFTKGPRHLPIVPNG